MFRVLRHCARIRSLRFVSGSPTLCSDSIPLFCFRFSGIVPRFDHFVLFRVLRHRPRILSLPFVNVVLEFDPFVLFRVLWHRTLIQSLSFFFLVLRHHFRIRSLCFVSSSPASCPDSIPSFVSSSPVALEFDAFILFRVLWHRAWIQSLCLVSGSPASCPNSILFFCFGFSGIVPGFDSGSLASCPDLIPSFCFRFSGIVPRFPSFHRHCFQIPHLLWNCAHISLSFSASCLDFPIITGIMSGSLIFPGIMLGFLLVLQSWRLSSFSLRYYVRG